MTNSSKPVQRICYICNLESTLPASTESLFFKSLSQYCGKDVEEKWGYRNIRVVNLGNANLCSGFDRGSSSAKWLEKTINNNLSVDNDFGIDFLFIIDHDLTPYDENEKQYISLYKKYKKKIQHLLNEIISECFDKESANYLINRFSIRLLELPKGQAFEFIIANSIKLLEDDGLVKNGEQIRKRISSALNNGKTNLSIGECKKMIMKKGNEICKFIDNKNNRNNVSLMEQLESNLNEFYSNVKQNKKATDIINYLDLFRS